MSLELISASAATAVPPSAMKSAAPATTIEGDGKCGRAWLAGVRVARFHMILLLCWQAPSLAPFGHGLEST
jgi:hypothetical protein